MARFQVLFIIFSGALFLFSFQNCSNSKTLADEPAKLSGASGACSSEVWKIRQSYPALLDSSFGYSVFKKNDEQFLRLYNKNSKIIAADILNSDGTVTLFMDDSSRSSGVDYTLFAADGAANQNVYYFIDKFTEVGKTVFNLNMLSDSKTGYVATLAESSVSNDLLGKTVRVDKEGHFYFLKKRSQEQSKPAIGRYNFQSGNVETFATVNLPEPTADTLTSVESFNLKSNGEIVLFTSKIYFTDSNFIFFELYVGTAENPLKTRVHSGGSNGHIDDVKPSYGKFEINQKDEVFISLLMYSSLFGQSTEIESHLMFVKVDASENISILLEKDDQPCGPPDIASDANGIPAMIKCEDAERILTNSNDQNLYSVSANAAFFRDANLNLYSTNTGSGGDFQILQRTCE